MAVRAETLTLNRRVFGILVVRDLKVRYAGSVLGYLWTILDPLLLALVYWFIFTVVIHRQGGADPYIVFLLAGMLPWHWANGVITESSRSITAEAKLVRSAGIPREIWVARVVASKFLEYLFAIPVLVAFMLIYQKGVSVEAVVDYPLAILIMGTLIFGIGLFLAPLSVLYRDLVRVIRIILRLLFYFSPIIYSTQTVANRLHGVLFDVYTLNPFAGVIELFRKPIFPEEFVGWHMVIKASIAALICLGIGIWVFRRLEGVVLKEI
jgi:ABC-2 type transport system permease protein